MSERTKSVQQGLAATGVILSLIFVGIEIRQNTDAVRGAKIQAISEQGIDHLLVGAGNSEWVQILTRFRAGAQFADLSPEDQMRYALMASASVRLMQNRFLQFKLGILDESGFEVGTGVHNPIYRSEAFLSFWREFDVAAEYDAEFVDFMETAVMGIRQ